MSIQFNGDLITNGGFEQGLSGWNFSNVGLGSTFRAHEGLLAVVMGLFDNTMDATLSQSVSVMSSQFYKLYFHLSGLSINSPSLEVTVNWLDANSNVIGSALSPSPLFLPGAAVGQSNEGEWKLVAAFTNQSPIGAASAVITFHKLPGAATEGLVIDDVVFTMQ